MDLGSHRLEQPQLNLPPTPPTLSPIRPLRTGQTTSVYSSSQARMTAGVVEDIVNECPTP